MSDDGRQQVETYLKGIGNDQRATLQKIRESIASIVPDAAEGLSYQLPAFFLGEKPIAGYGASKKHCAYYPMSGSITAALAEDLSDYETSKGAVKFTSDKPLPKSLIKKLLKARITEIKS